MIFSKSQDKSRRLESKGDTHRAKRKPRKALEHYREAVSHNEERLELYDKLIATLAELREEWTEADFADSVYWEMKKQELTDPTFRRLHARGAPEHTEVTVLIKAMLAAKTREEETAAVEKIADYGEAAVYPLVDFLLNYKEMGEKLAKLRNKPTSPST